ncbi:hypothetical protein VSR68_36210 [Paraburkholderia phymatum]|uniref:hypothetical protein n=1 Tax=Paraburkholderia phymatum TaxID=148447 RepID=UPI003170C856
MAVDVVGFYCSQGNARDMRAPDAAPRLVIARGRIASGRIVRSCVTAPVDYRRLRVALIANVS